MLSGPEQLPLSDQRHTGAMTLIDVLREAARRSPQRGCTTFDLQGAKTFRTWAQLLEQSLRVGAALEHAGLTPGMRLFVWMPSGLELLTVFFGAQSAGLIPVPLAPPRQGRHDDSAVTQHVLKLAGDVGAHALIHDASLPAAWRPVRGPTNPIERIFELERLLDAVPLGAACAQRAEHDEVAYIQISSGTSAPPRAVALTHAGILQNTRAVARALSLTSSDLGVSWLPLDNIMGLLGFVVLPMDWGIDTVLIAPERFLARPQDWLWTISQHRATLTAAPDFAYHACVRRINETDLQGLDLSSLRVAMSGGEPARARHMEAFARRFRKHGFADDAFLPVYGLTEATLAVSFSAVQQPYTLLGLNRKVLEVEGWVAPLPAAGAPTPYERMHLVSVGVPLEGVQVRVSGPTGEDLGAGQLGVLHVSSPGQMSGYVGDVTGGVEVLPGGWLATGDVGFIHEGQLYIVTRERDLIKTRGGRRLIPDEIELFVNAIDGVRTGSAVAFEAGESRHVVVACEILPGADAEEIELQIRQSLLRHLDLSPDALLTLAPFSVPRTRDGKVQRPLSRRLYQLGKLDRRDRTTELDGVRRFAQRVRGDVIRLAQGARARVEGWWRTR